ncbi:swnK, partial [Symbiodinium necroappetens]
AFRIEHPELRTVSLDLADASASGLARQLQLRRSEPELAVRNGTSHVPRLVVATSRLQNAQSGQPVDPDFGEGLYVVTGGTGALGLVFVDWMVRCGARGRFALLSRSGQPQADSKAAFRRLEKEKEAQVEISACKCDISSRADLLRVLTKENDQGHVVKGILHAAGTLADGLIKTGQSRATLKAACSAKVDGSLQLHTVAAELGLPLEFMWLFSSAAAIIGSVAQGNYCAANAFMDAMGARRRAKNLPAISVQWGPWADVGMAAR